MWKSSLDWNYKFPMSKFKNYMGMIRELISDKRSETWNLSISFYVSPYLWIYEVLSIKGIIFQLLARELTSLISEKGCQFEQGCLTLLPAFDCWIVKHYLVGEWHSWNIKKLRLDFKVESQGMFIHSGNFFYWSKS